MRYLHTMVRVTDLEASLYFYRDALGLEVLRTKEVPSGRFTLVFLAAPGDSQAQVELTYNWDSQALQGGRNFGHLAYAVENIYSTCERLHQHGVTILRPPSRWLYGLCLLTRQHISRAIASRSAATRARTMGQYVKHRTVVI